MTVERVGIIGSGIMGAASEATIATATAFAESCGRETVLVRDEAGFVVNALLFS